MDCQFVKTPVMLTLRVRPRCPAFGSMLVTVDTPCRTLKPLTSVTTSVPVVTVTLRDPLVALGEMVIGTDASVGPFTVTVPAVMPAPKKAVVS